MNKTSFFEKCTDCDDLLTGGVIFARYFVNWIISFKTSEEPFETIKLAQCVTASKNKFVTRNLGNGHGHITSQWLSIYL